MEQISSSIFVVTGNFHFFKKGTKKKKKLNDGNV